MKPTFIRFDPNFIAAILILILLAFSVSARSQGLEITSRAQQTIMGMQTGHGIEYRSSKGFGVGGFYQSTNYMSFEQSVTNYPFYGLDLSAPLVKCGNVQVLAHVMTGMVNQKFLIVTPEVETRMTITGFLKLGVGAGYRSRQAAVSARLIITTF